MKIVSIDFDSSISEIEVDNIEYFIKQNRLIQIYYWRYNDKRINCYVNIEENIIRNSHILPSSGISDIFDIESEQIEIENTIYMISSQNTDFCELTLEEYGLFYFESNETTSSDDDISIESDDESETKNIIKSIEILQIDTNNTLDYDMNEY
tara:strand:+ start:63 stop:518 length:456 start_codon:yes stop_codon:yes gene_type:complete